MVNFMLNMDGNNPKTVKLRVFIVKPKKDSRKPHFEPFIQEIRAY
jgi:hypothetical protein